MVTVLNSVGKQVLGIFKSQAYFGKPAGAAGFGAIEYQALQVFTAQVTDLLFTDHPADAIHDITFTATIGPHDAGNIIIKIYNGLIGKAFKAL